MEKKLKKCILILLFVMSLAGCNAGDGALDFSSLKGKPQPIQKSGIAFDTIITITVYDSDDTVILDDCFNLCNEYEKKFSRTVETSEISKINSASGEPVEVSDETFELIQRGIYYGDISNGLFDITIAPVSELWDFHEENDSNSDASYSRIPEKNSIDNAKKHVSYKNIVLDEKLHTVMLMDSEAKIDLGGIAKGYIADKLKEYLLGQGVNSALINLGGNILAVGAKPDGSPFHIGIKKPFSEGEIEKDVDLVDKAVSTSGVYERYFYENDRLYHHILLPSTGYPVESDLYAASVICKSSTDADALSTICVLLGKEKAEKLINTLDGVEVLFLPEK